jgi:hypothetical protein
VGWHLCARAVRLLLVEDDVDDLVLFEEALLEIVRQ